MKAKMEINHCCTKCTYFRFSPWFPMECFHPYFNNKPAYAGCIAKWNEDIKNGIPGECPILKGEKMAIQTIDDMIKNLTNIKEKHGNLPLVYAIDEEGNAFHGVYFTPTLGHFKEDNHEFAAEDNIKEEPDSYPEDEYPINALCIN